VPLDARSSQNTIFFEFLPSISALLFVRLVKPSFAPESYSPLPICLCARPPPLRGSTHFTQPFSRRLNKVIDTIPSAGRRKKPRDLCISGSERQKAGCSMVDENCMND
jgi:hypothetical protein